VFLGGSLEGTPGESGVVEAYIFEAFNSPVGFEMNSVDGRLVRCHLLGTTVATRGPSRCLYCIHSEGVVVLRGASRLQLRPRLLEDVDDLHCENAGGIHACYIDGWNKGWRSSSLRGPFSRGTVSHQHARSWRMGASRPLHSRIA
jgi:hypothetical protein